MHSSIVREPVALGLIASAGVLFGVSRVSTAGGTRDAKDERQVRITLTAKGRDLHGPVKQAWDQVVCAVGLSPAELEALKAQIHRLRETLDVSLA